MAPPDGSSNPDTVSVHGPSMDKAATVITDSNDSTLANGAKTVQYHTQVQMTLGANSLSSDLTSALTTHHNAVVGGLKTMNSYIIAAQALVTAIRTIRQNYSDADLASADSSSAITTLLTQAQLEAQAKAPLTTPDTSPRDPKLDAQRMADRNNGSGYAAQAE